MADTEAMTRVRIPTPPSILLMALPLAWDRLSDGTGSLGWLFHYQHPLCPSLDVTHAGRD